MAIGWSEAEEAIALAMDSEFARLPGAGVDGDWKVGNEVRGVACGTVMVNDLISGFFAIAERLHGGGGLRRVGTNEWQSGFGNGDLKYVDVDRRPRMEKAWWYRYGGDLEMARDAFLSFEFAGGMLARVCGSAGRAETMFRRPRFEVDGY